MSARKQVKQANKQRQKQVIQKPVSSDNQCMIWVFDSVDTDGCFRFDPKREDFDAADIFDKLIHYSKRTWSDVKKETHDRGKSKHHFLDKATLSPEAESRISSLHLEERRDQIFSLHLSNRHRIIGLREHEKFIVKWYDPEHGFCPSNKS